MAPANNFSASSTIDWDKVRIFYVAADAGSFTHAGDVLQISQSAVSRQVSALERDLGVPLFHRHARGLILTEQGEHLFRTAKEMMLKFETARCVLQTVAKSQMVTYALQPLWALVQIGLDHGSENFSIFIQTFDCICF